MKVNGELILPMRELLVMKTNSKILFFLLVLVLTSLAHADTIYNYAGNAMACVGACPASQLTLNGTMALSSPLAPNLFIGAVTPTSYDFVVTGGPFPSQHFTQGAPGPHLFSFI